jgi:Zn finger protein HypA/HybF involved in hydrogenase expression
MRKRIAGKTINGKWTLSECQTCGKAPAFVKSTMIKKEEVKTYTTSVLCKKCGSGKTDVVSGPCMIPESLVELFPV